jgi:cellobiose phosphorylase
VREGWLVLEGIYRHCQDFAVSRMYPGLPEYISERGRGMYPWLTGSASWYLLTLLTEVFGVKGDLGDLVLEPKLVAAQFDPQGDASIRTQFAERDLEIVYHNPRGLDYGAYAIQGVASGDLPTTRDEHAIRIARSNITDLASGKRHRVIVTLG